MRVFWQSNIGAFVGAHKLLIKGMFTLRIAAGEVAPPAVMAIGVVPVRYIVGQTANIVPVETVLTNEAGVVPVREFVGPANVVPVRETATETPRVKVRKV